MKIFTFNQLAVLYRVTSYGVSGISLSLWQSHKALNAISIMSQFMSLAAQMSHFPVQQASMNYIWKNQYKIYESGKKKIAFHFS